MKCVQYVHDMMKIAKLVSVSEKRSDSMQVQLDGGGACASPYILAVCTSHSMSMVTRQPDARQFLSF